VSSNLRIARSQDQYFSLISDFSGVAIPADAGTDYVEISPSALTTPQRPQARQGTVRRSPRHLVRTPAGQFPVCQIQPSNLTPFKGHDSGFLSTRRMPNDFFLVAAARRVTMEVGESRGRLLVSAPNTGNLDLSKKEMNAANSSQNEPQLPLQRWAW
jgi:hypothetical protein